MMISAALRHRLKRLRVWLFLCHYSSDWRRIVITLVAWVTLLYILAHQSRRGKRRDMWGEVLN